MCIVRPVLEYACPVWHTNLPIYLSDDIEMVQKRVLKSIFQGKCYNDILNHTGISSLKERRDHLCRKYFNDMKVNSHKLNHLLPEKRQVEYDLRPVNAYPLPQTRTDRYRKSIFQGKCYNDILNHTGISSLKKRRDHLCRKYFNDMKVNSHKLNHLLPEKRQVEYDLRPVNAYPLPQTRTDRYRKSIFQGKCYNDILNHTGISSLKERRDHLCRKYFNDMKLNSHKLNLLLPEKRQVEYDLRPVNAYPLPQTRTDRYRKSIFQGKCYNDILNHTGISSLKERRDHLCRKYFNDMKVNSHKLNHLLPEKRQVEYDLRPVNAYPLPQTRTDRYRNSIIPWC